MGAQPGYLAILQIGSTPAIITGIRSAEIKIAGDVYEITAFSDGQWKKKLGGLADYTLSFSGNLDMSDVQQQLLQASIITNPGQQVPWAIMPQGVGTGKPKYSGVVLVKGEDIKFDVKSEEQVQFDLEGTGAPIYTLQ